MKFIREYCPSNKICVIRTDAYAHRLDHFLNLYNEIQKDYPAITFDDVTVIHYGGDRYKRTYGLEFTPPSIPNEEYMRIEMVEFEL